MNRDIRDRWTAALRGGRYEQTTGQLAGGTHGVPRFCCLGVLCDLHSAETGGQWNGDTYLLEDTGLPQEVLEWAGLPSKSRSVEVLGHPHLPGTLAGLNDGGASFKTIATVIEEEL